MRFHNLKDGNWVRLSHVLDTTTPAYGDGEKVVIQKVRSMCCGDTSNAIKITLSNHIGTHVDAPRHFIADGLAVDQYDVKSWIFTKPLLIEVPAKESEILGIVQFEKALKGCKDCDLLLVKTGFELMRGAKSYWEKSPSFAPELAGYLKERLPSIDSIGMDTISLTGYQNRELGRQAHTEFLKREFRIFEDLSLLALSKDLSLEIVFSFPLLILGADGAPCGMYGLINTYQKILEES